MGWLVTIVLILVALIICGLSKSSPDELCSEEEYLRLMPDDISPETALTVRRILADVSGWDVDEIWPHTTLFDITEN